MKHSHRYPVLSRIGLMGLPWLIAAGCHAQMPAPAEAVAATVAGAGAAREAADPFAGQATVRVDALFRTLSGQVAELARASAVREDYLQWLGAQKNLGDSPALYQDYVRVRLAFEATRAGGLWGLQWRVTDQLPQSDRVWAQWRSLSLRDGAALPVTTAIAECDELSALFAFVAHGLGLSRQSQVGLLWPTSNHTVAVWVFGHPASGTRTVLPTSQVFLDGAQSLGTRAFDPWKQKIIYDYRRVDARPDSVLPAPLARAMLQAVRQYGALSQARLQQMRNQRELKGRG